MAGPFILSIKFPSPKYALCQVWLKISPVVLEKIFLFRQWIFAIPLLYLLGKERHHSFEQMGISYTQGYFVASLIKIGPMVLEKIFKFSSMNFGYFDAIFFSISISSSQSIVLIIYLCNTMLLWNVYRAREPFFTGQNDESSSC